MGFLKSIFGKKDKNNDMEIIKTMETEISAIEEFESQNNIF